MHLHLQASAFFQKYDKDRDGTISLNEFTVAINEARTMASDAK